MTAGLTTSDAFSGLHRYACARVTSIIRKTRQRLSERLAVACSITDFTDFGARAGKGGDGGE